MNRSNKLVFINLTQYFLDISAIIFGFFFAYIFVNMFRSLHEIKFYVWILVVFIPTWIMIMNSYEMYNDTKFNIYPNILKIVTNSTIISGVVIVFLIFTAKIEGFSRLFMATFLSGVIFLVFNERVIYLNLTKNLRSKFKKQVIIVGTPLMYKKFNSYLIKTNLKYNVKGFVSVSNSEPLSKHLLLGKIEKFENMIKQYTIDEVILALPKNYVGEVEEYLLLCESMGITVRMIVDLYDLKLSKIHITNIGALPLITFHTVSLDRFQLMLKRILDIIGSIIGLIITFMLGIFIVIAIKIDSKGPIIFKQNRVGINGRLFKCYKFRSMANNAEIMKERLMNQNEVKGDLMFKIKDDPRITKVGSFIRKTSLDELPQFWNVLKGDMSLVGTRPPTVDEVSKYSTCHRRRISIKPGITGLWQVNGRSKIKDFEEVVKLDTCYIDNWSISMDIKIILKTFIVLLKGINEAY